MLDRLMKDIVTEHDEFDVSKFIPLISERIASNNAYVRQFLLGWIIVLDSIPDISIIEYLPQFLHGIFRMLSDTNKEMVQQASTALDEFIAEIEESAESIDFGPLVKIVITEGCASDNTLIKEKALIWLYKFMCFGKERLLPFNAQLLGFVLPCVAHKQESIRKTANLANDQLQKLIQDTKQSIDYSRLLEGVISELVKLSVPSRIAALQWLHILLNKNMQAVMEHIDKLFPLLLKALSDSSEDVVTSVLGVLAIISTTEQNFTYFLASLLKLFKTDKKLLHEKSSFIIRQLSIMLNPEKIYRELAHILLTESNLEFCSLMIQTLNTILLTSKELSEMRHLIKNSTTLEEGRDLFTTLYQSWCHNPVATLCLCLLAKAYRHASALVINFSEIEPSVSFLVQIDNMVQLLESPVFAELRLQLLEPHKHPYLLKTLYGILMLLPQSSAHQKLQNRMQCISTLSLLHMISQNNVSTDNKDSFENKDYAQLVDHFRKVQETHKLARSGDL
jgi:vacuole morphology and inheritance protein 14